jgi:K+-transporting ATPase KdpF subunit
MSLIYAFAFVIALGLLCYLAYALMKPERF